MNKENPMKNVDIEIPADAKMVTLTLNQGGGQSTLRNILPTIRDNVELVIEDVMGVETCDNVRMSAGDGPELMKKLKRSTVLDGDLLLELEPIIRVLNPHPRLINGTSCVDDDASIRLFVAWPRPDEEEAI